MLELAKCLTHLPARVITVDLHIALFYPNSGKIEVTIVGGRIDGRVSLALVVWPQNVA